MQECAISTSGIEFLRLALEMSQACRKALRTVLYVISILSSAQTCQWKMFVWGGDPIQAIDIQPLIPTMDLDTFVTNGEWELRSTRGWPEVVFQGGADYAFVFYEITLRRRPSLLALTVLLPVLVLALVNVFVFTIPSEAGGCCSVRIYL